MKRIASLLLVVVLVLSMSVPAFAVVDKSELYENYLAARALCMSSASEFDSTYKYYLSCLYLYADGRANYQFYFTTSPVFGVGSPFLTVGYNINDVIGIVDVPRILNDVKNVGSSIYLYNSGATAAFTHYVENWSTAQFSSDFDLSQVSYDWFVSIPLPPPDKTALQALINTASAITQGSYTESSWAVLQSQIIAAQAVNEQSDATQEQVDAACTSLQSAIDVLVSVDKTALQALLSSAGDMEDVGYTSESWQALQDSIVSAQYVYGYGDSSQGDVDAAYSDLFAAMESLELIPPVELDSIESLVIEAETLVESDYTPESWTYFSARLLSVRSLLDSLTYTQSQIDSAFMELSLAISALVPAVVTPDPPSVPETPGGGMPSYSGIEVPASVMSSLKSGDVEGMLDIFTSPFLDHALSAMPIVIGLFAITFGLKLIPRIFKKFF